MSELTEHLRHIGCLNKPRCIEAADLLDAQATELARLRKQEPVAYVSIIDDDKPRSDIIDRELPPLTPLYAAPIPPVTPSQQEELRKQEPVATVCGAFSSIKVNLRIDGDLPIGTKLYVAPIPLTDEIVEIKRQRDSAVGSLEWIHNATKTGASIDVICGYTKGALQEVRLAAPIPTPSQKELIRE